MARPIDSEYKKYKELSFKLEELILEAHFFGGKLTELYKDIDKCLEFGFMTKSESKTLKNEDLMKEIAIEIYE